MTIFAQKSLRATEHNSDAFVEEVLRSDAPLVLGVVELR